MPTSILEVARNADLFFMSMSPIHEAMRRLTSALNEMNIPFAVAGAMAANAHGHKRTTADIDILIRKEDLDRFKERYMGRGWVEKFEGSKNFRDTVCNVNIDTLLVGGFPGDGLPKPVAFPEPELVAEPGDEGIPYISLVTLIELKLASGLTASHRMQDFADVMNLIRVNHLAESFADDLNPFVADKFKELRAAAQVNEDY